MIGQYQTRPSQRNFVNPNISFISWRLRTKKLVEFFTAKNLQATAMPGINQKRLVKYEAPEWAKQVKDLPKYYVKVN